MQKVKTLATLLVALMVTVAFGEAQTLNVGGIDQAGGTVKGVVKFDGRQAKRSPIRMSADKFCADAHQEPQLSERYVFGDNDALQNVLVYVSKGLEGKTFPTPDKALLDQHGCVYVPHVLAVMTGQELDIKNSDSTLHNVNAKATKNGSFNEGMPVKDQVIAKKFDTAEMAIPFSCQVHPWMNAFVHVLPHPFFAITQQDGSYEIKGLPAGEYEISVWHEFDKFTPNQNAVKVTVSEGAAQEVNFSYAPPGGK